MESIIESKFKDVYTELLNKFIDELGSKLDLQNIPSNLPRPFIPEYGGYYLESNPKIAFIGRDAKYNPFLKGFLNAQNPLKDGDIINYNYEDEDAYPEFLDYTNGKSFWNFVLLFLGSLYNVEYETLLKNCHEPTMRRILGSFVHGNVNSVMRMYPGNEVIDFINWEIVKKASGIFDKAEHLLNAFKPSVVLLLHYSENDFNWDWLPKEIEKYFVEKLDNDIDYYLLDETQTHMFWTYHPSYKHFQTFDVIDTIINKMRILNLI